MNFWMEIGSVENSTQDSWLGGVSFKPRSSMGSPSRSSPESSDSAVDGLKGVDSSSSSAPDVTNWTRLDQPPQLVSRRFQRISVEATRSLALQLLGADGEPCSGWSAADIIDISLGGVCLLVLQSFPLPQGDAPRLRLNLRSQPGFGIDSLDGRIRWFVQSGLVLTLGVGFEKPLEQLPSLLRCRRATPRDLEPGA